VVGVLLIRGLLGIPILSAKGQLVDQAMATVPITAGLGALGATALLHLLLLTTPRATAFFGAICSIVIAIMVLQVFIVGGTMEQEAATSMLYVVIGRHNLPAVGSGAHRGAEGLLGGVTPGDASLAWRCAEERTSESRAVGCPARIVGWVPVPCLRSPVSP
jgi:hypothetical protein